MKIINDIFIRINKKFVLIFFCINFFITISNAQSVTSIESKYESINKQYLLESAVLDSLKNVMNARAKAIDTEKQKPDVDENLVKKLMASSVILSDKIDQQQLKVNSMESELEKLKYSLSEKYTSMIDSLTDLENSNKFAGNREDLKAQIITLTEKKILYAPRIYSLSFSPEKILSLNPAKAKTADEKEIYNEYLNSALSEVESRLSQVQDVYSEVKQTLALQKKTNKFLEEVEFGSDMNVHALSLNRSSANQTNSYSGDNNKTRTSIENSSANYLSQVQIYISMLEQLDINLPKNLKIQIGYPSDSDKKLSLQKYSELLEKVEDGLKDYISVLKNKIGNGK